MSAYLSKMPTNAKRGESLSIVITGKGQRDVRDVAMEDPDTRVVVGKAKDGIATRGNERGDQLS